VRNLANIFIRRNAGFFSDFLTCLAGIKFCHDHEMDFYVDWKNDNYPTLNENNLFDEFFFQKKLERHPNLLFNNLTPYGHQFTDVANETCEEKLYNFYKPFSDLLTNLKILNTNFF